MTLPAGYLGSSAIGALLIFAGFDLLASKIAALVLGVMLLILLYWAKNWLARAIALFFVGLIVGLWFIEHGYGLKFYVLFIGVMSCLYSVWDISDDLIFRKVNASDASQFARYCGCLPAQGWGVLWLLISLAFLVGAVIGGLVTFKDDSAMQEARAAAFLPT